MLLFVVAQRDDDVRAMHACMMPQLRKRGREQAKHSCGCGDVTRSLRTGLAPYRVWLSWCPLWHSPCPSATAETKIQQTPRRACVVSMSNVAGGWLREMRTGHKAE